MSQAKPRPLDADSIASFETTDDVEQAARRHLVQPWAYLDRLGEEALPLLDSSEGVYLYDGDGNRLLDGPAGMWCVQVGYRRREIAQAMADQAMQMAYNSPWYSTSSPAAELASRIAAVTPGDLDKVFFTTGGSTAVDSALRFVHFLNNYLGRPEKKMILARQDAYHGSTYLSASCSGKPRDRDYLDFARDQVAHLRSPNPYRRPKGTSADDFADLLIREMEAKILEIGPERIGAFIAEPVLASGGVIVPPADYHRRTRDLCTKYDIVYIADEVVTAFGRLGHWFASEEVFGITPDIVTFAKGVTSGYVPLGGLAISETLLNRLAGVGEPAMFANGFTYSGHPVACAAALANMDIIEREGILAHVREVAPHFQARMAELREIPLVGDVRGVGLMAGIECVVDEPADDALARDYALGERIDRHCQALGLLVRPLINMCVLSPPLVISRAQIDRLADILAEGIRRTAADVAREGLSYDS